MQRTCVYAKQINDFFPVFSTANMADVEHVCIQYDVDDDQCVVFRFLSLAVNYYTMTDDDVDDYCTECENCVCVQ